MKERIQEALRRRHRKGDEGFTLIELLVVILIIAILAAVAIVALIGALRAGRKSAAKTTLRNAVTDVKSVQTGDGIDDYSTVDAGSLGSAETDIKYNDNSLTNPNAIKGKNAVDVVRHSTDEVVLLTQDNDGNCFLVELYQNESTKYTANTSCTAPAHNDGAWNEDQADGWKI
jgi:type IV pilus assembly protein PilA